MQCLFLIYSFFTFMVRIIFLLLHRKFSNSPKFSRCVKRKCHKNVPSSLCQLRVVLFYFFKNEFRFHSYDFLIFSFFKFIFQYVLVCHFMSFHFIRVTAIVFVLIFYISVIGVASSLLLEAFAV